MTGIVDNLLEHIPSPILLSLPAPTTVRHVTTYLVFLVLSSIALFVFLNSTISFVVTDILEIRRGKDGQNILGNIVGTLGLVDEITVIVSAPLWGLLSDRWRWGGRKGVSALGFFIAALGLLGLSGASLVKGKNGNGKGIQLEGWEWWYWLVVWRAVFAVGGGAISTMISAVLPDLTSPPAPTQYTNPVSTVLPPPHLHHHGAPLSPPLPPYSPTITRPPTSPSSKLAGIVGLFSGLGALLALGVFLPLPALLDSSSHSPVPDTVVGSATSTGAGLKRSYWTVSTYAVICGTACWFWLPHYGDVTPQNRVESRFGNGISRWWRFKFGKRSGDPEEAEGLLVDEQGGLQRDTRPSVSRMFIRALKVGRDRWRTIGISYIGGFIARASSVGLSLFIPLFVNHYFITHGLCDPSSNPDDKEEMKKQCRRAYIVAAELTGVSQLTGLICAPLIGYLSSSASSTQPATSPLRVLCITSLLGAIGFTGFGFLNTPEVGVLSIFFSSLLGVGQIGAVVGSLGLLGRGQGEEFDTEFDLDMGTASESDLFSAGEESLEGADTRDSISVGSNNPGELKGTIAGVYSLCGGLGILLLTKGGGLLFDKWSSGAPFWVLGGFMGGLALLTGVEGWVRGN